MGGCGGIMAAARTHIHTDTHGHAHRPAAAGSGPASASAGFMPPPPAPPRAAPRVAGSCSLCPLPARLHQRGSCSTAAARACVSPHHVGPVPPPPPLLLLLLGVRPSVRCRAHAQRGHSLSPVHCSWSRPRPSTLDYYQRRTVRKVTVTEAHSSTVYVSIRD